MPVELGVTRWELDTVNVCIVFVSRRYMTPESEIAFFLSFFLFFFLQSNLLSMHLVEKVFVKTAFYNSTHFQQDYFRNGSQM